MLGLLALLSFAVTFAALKLLLARFARVALDQPNERSLHERPVPRTGGIAVLAGAAISLAVAATGDAPLAAASAALGAAAGAFLLLNFPPARIFLGDVGSVPLGFLAAALGLAGWRDDVWPLWFALLVFAPFIGDATLTLI